MLLPSICHVEHLSCRFHLSPVPLCALSRSLPKLHVEVNCLCSQIDTRLPSATRQAGAGWLSLAGEPTRIWPTGRRMASADQPAID
jgi:hypothetical protein